MLTARKYRNRASKLVIFSIGSRLKDNAFDLPVPSEIGHGLEPWNLCVLPENQTDSAELLPGAVRRSFKARNGKFESTSLQRRVHVSRDFALRRREAGFSRGCAGRIGAARSAETGIARCMAPTGGNISVGPNSSTAASMRRWFNKFRSRSCKAEYGPLLVPGKR